MNKWGLVSAVLLVGGCYMTEVVAENSVVQLTTNKGDIVLEIFDDKAPLSANNFLSYVSDGFYSDTIFHRVISNFMIQGGGMDESLQPKKTRPPIKNEAINRISNTRGTVAMARTYVVDSATAQFFVNVVDNPFLDFKSENPDGYGYAVFGKVIDGMDTVDAIRTSKTGSVGVYNDVPIEPIVIVKATIIKRGTQAPKVETDVLLDGANSADVSSQKTAPANP